MMDRTGNLALRKQVHKGRRLNARLRPLLFVHLCVEMSWSTQIAGT